MRVKSRWNTMEIKNKISLWPIFMVVAFIPLILNEYRTNRGMSQEAWYPDGEYFDLFLYWKSISLCFLGFMMGVILLISFRRLIKEIYFLPLVIYGVFAIISTFFSIYFSGSFYGGIDHYESIWILLTYILLAYYSYMAISCEKDLEKIIKWVGIGIGGVLIITVSQLISHDIYQVLFKEYTFNFEEGRVYGPFYNPNYVGTYVTLLLPVTIMAAFAVKEKIKKSFWTIASILLIAVLIGSKSATGFIIMLFTLLLLIILKRNIVFKIKKTTWRILLGILIIFSVIFGKKIKESYLDKIITSFLTLTEEQKTISLEGIETNPENLIIHYKGNQLYIGMDVADTTNKEFNFIIWDESNSGVPLETNEETGEIILTDERFNGIKIKAIIINDLNDLIGFSVYIDDKEWYFTNQTDGTYYIITNAGKLDKINPSPSAFSSKYYNFASGRGYLWAKTIPLLKKTLFYGTGPDTFAIAYPNNDYVNNYNNEYDTTYVTKPHNLYLQIGVQTGVISLFAFLIFYGIYCINSLKIYWNRKIDTWESKIGVGIFVGTFGYMLTGFTNDSTITVAPIFWCFMGIGIAVNQKLVKIY